MLLWRSRNFKDPTYNTFAQRDWNFDRNNRYVKPIFIRITQSRQFLHKICTIQPHILVRVCLKCGALSFKFCVMIGSFAFFLQKWSLDLVAANKKHFIHSFVTVAILKIHNKEFLIKKIIPLK